MAEIAYFQMKNGQRFYFSVIIDLYSRKVLSWIVAPRTKAEFVIDTLEKAIRNHKNSIPKNILFHNDRGVQYTSDEFRQVLKRLGITQSMSGKSECWDNAPYESFWGKLKQEWLVQYGSFENIEQVRLALFEYIDDYYYAKRLHQVLGYRTPRDVKKEFLRNDRCKMVPSFLGKLWILVTHITFATDLRTIYLARLNRRNMWC